MNFEEKKNCNYPYDYQISGKDFVAVTQTIGKLPKIKLALPKISIAENFELKIA